MTSTISGGSWTYAGPGASDKDAVRFLVGDTDSRDQLLADEEIDWLVSEHGSVYVAAAWACDQIIASGRLVDKQVEGLRISASQRANNYRKLAKTLRSRPRGRKGLHAGGISISDKKTQGHSSDRPAPAFRLGQFDNPAVGAQAGDGESYLTTTSTGTVGN